MVILDKFYDVDFNENVLMLDKVKDFSHYDATPIGAKVFASMGVDGVHYCIVPKDKDIILENSPVYRISPMDFSEGTVIWTAKNLYDFLNISVALKDFWVLPLLVEKLDMGEDVFMSEIKTHKEDFELRDENEKTELTLSMDSISKAFNFVKINNIFQYLLASYSDAANHARLEFTTSEIIEKKRGFYSYK